MTRELDRMKMSSTISNPTLVFATHNGVGLLSATP
jgi:hypothetical protein